MFISEDARVVASVVPGEAGNASRILFQDAETERKLGVGQLEKDVEVEWEMVSFSADCRELLLPGRVREKFCVQALPVAAGLKRVDELPMLAGAKGRLIMLAGIPGRRAFVGCWSQDRVEEKKPSRVSVLDLQTRMESPLTAIDVVPHRGIYDSRLWVSKDGNYVALADILAKDRSGFVVVELASGEVALKHAENLVTFPNLCFAGWEADDRGVGAAS